MQIIKTNINKKYIYFKDRTLLYNIPGFQTNPGSTISERNSFEGFGDLKSPVMFVCCDDVLTCIIVVNILVNSSAISKCRLSAWHMADLFI